MMKKTILVCSLLSLPQFLFSQVKINQNKIPYLKNEIGMEIGGNSLFYSVYYQRALFKKNKSQFNIRIGTSLFPSFRTGTLLNPTSPLRIGAYILPNVLLFKNRHAWELGIATTMITAQDDVGYYDYVTGLYSVETNHVQLFLLSPQFGYRLYLKKNMYFRAMASTMILLGTHQSSKAKVDFEPKAIPWAGVGFGYCFGKN